MATKLAQTSLLSNKLLFHTSLRDKFLGAKYSVSTVHSLKDDPKSHSTVHKEEIKKFSELTVSWWDCKGPMKPLHSMNSIRIPFVRDGLIQCPNEKRSLTPLKDKKILDVGCGGGILSEGLAKIGAEVTGIDASKDLIEIAKDHSKNNPKLITKPNYLCVTIEEHSEQHQNHYDAVVASEVIEHVNNKELFVKKCVNVLKPGGSIFFTTPNRTNVSKFLAIYAAEYIFNVVPRGTHQFDMFITPNELTFLLERNQCHVEAVYGTFYNLMCDKWDFINSHALMYALHAEKSDI